MITAAAWASASGRQPSSPASSAAPAASACPVRAARNVTASASVNTSTGTGVPSAATARWLLVMITCACPAAGRNRRSSPASAALSNTSRHRWPSASSQCRTAVPAATASPPGAGRPSPAAVSASPASSPPSVSALTHATSRQPAASRARAQAAASWVLPTPRIPVSARTTRTPGPGPPSAASRSARGWNPGDSCGISPATTTPGPRPPPPPPGRRSANSRSDRSTSCPSVTGSANVPTARPLSSRTRRRNTSCRAPYS